MLRQGTPLDRVSHEVAILHPDALVVRSDRVKRVLLRELHAIRDTAPLPVILLTRDGNPDSINAAVKAGVTAYVVDNPDPARIGHLLQVARIRFGEIQGMKEALQETRTRFSERAFVERAKGILMKSRNLGEDEAYRMMHKHAMNKNKCLGEVAEQIIDTAKLLL
jgi:response regulator NasT